MKHTKKISALLAAWLALSAIFCSCASDAGDQNGVSNNSGGTTATENGSSETLGVPNTRYDGTELCFLTRAGVIGVDGWCTSEIYAERMTAESGNVSVAVYERNDRILNDYGVTITELRKDLDTHVTAVRKEYKLPDLYELVESGEWTMGKLAELEANCKSDLNGDGKLTYDADVCGFAYTANAAHCILVGGDISMCIKNEEDIPVYALDVERTQNIADQGQLIFDKEYTIDLEAAVASSGKPIEEVGNIAFAGNHALFYSECMLTVSHLRGYDVDFGIIPNPKYNKEQDTYSSFMHMTASMVSIPQSIRENDLVMISSMIEAMAYHSVDTLTEQYYEINLKTKTAKDEQSGPMLDRIFADRVCDLAYYYQWGGDAYGSIARCLLPGANKSVASQSKQCKTRIDRNISKLISEISD